MMEPQIDLPVLSGLVEANAPTPLEPVHLSDLAAIYLLTGEYDKVMSFTNRALALDSSYPQCHTRRLQNR